MNFLNIRQSALSLPKRKGKLRGFCTTSQGPSNQCPVISTSTTWCHCCYSVSSTEVSCGTERDFQVKSTLMLFLAAALLRGCHTMFDDVVMEIALGFSTTGKVCNHGNIIVLMKI